MIRGDVTRDAQADGDHQHHCGSHLLLETAWRSRCGAVRFARLSMSHVFVFQGFSPTLFVRHFFIELVVFILYGTVPRQRWSLVMFPCPTHLLTKSIPPKVLRTAFL